MSGRRSVKTLIEDRREEAGLSRRELANRLGISETQMGRLENYDTDDPRNPNTREPGLDVLEKIARELSVAVVDLLPTGSEHLTGAELEPIDTPTSAVLARHNLRTYRVRASSVESVIVGEDVLVNQGEAAIANAKSGDVLLVSVGGVLSLWQFLAPSLLCTNRRGANITLRTDAAVPVVQVLGVVERV